MIWTYTKHHGALDDALYREFRVSEDTLDISQASDVAFLNLDFRPEASHISDDLQAALTVEAASRHDS